jgi:hypothetical protein
MPQELACGRSCATPQALSTTKRRVRWPVSSLDIGAGKSLNQSLDMGSATNVWVYIISCLAAAAIAIGAAVSLEKFQEPAAVAFATSGVRI